MSTTPEHLKRQIDQVRSSVSVEESLEESTEMNTHPSIRLLLSAAAGTLFGIALEKGRVFEPQVIRDQMLFQRFAMLKMFLSAATMGLISFAFLSVIPSTMKRLEQAKKNFHETTAVKSVLGVATGGAIMGAGLTISGACPGTVLVQLGTGVTNAWLTALGGLTGALLYAFTVSGLPGLFFWKTKPKFMFLDKYLNIPYARIAIPLSCVFATVVFGIEHFSPWYTEVDSSLVTYGLMNAGAWPPFAAGMIIGSLQIPIVLANENTLGSASSYVTILSNAWPFSNQEEKYLKIYRHGVDNWWQVIFVGCAVFGGFVSATASGSFGTVEGLPWHHAFTGGLLMIYGARLAGGCTSGHGLSGMGLLALQSFVAVPAMFGSGIATAVFMKYVLGTDM